MVDSVPCPGRRFSRRHRRRIWIATLGVCGLLFGWVAAPGAAEGRTASGPHDVADLLAKAPQTGRVNVTGFVARIFLCPACPAGATCKPCLGDHLVLSDAKRSLGPGDDLGPGDVVLFADRALLRPLRVGRRYRLEVEIRDTQSAAPPMKDMALVKAKAAR
ncbi:MAG: hypothetical protein QOI66_27 [Myxococcales bacterium]|jgi:hypothetical protein|nr:hypothetical protein [Myxococcales bacterium]